MEDVITLVIVLLILILLFGGGILYQIVNVFVGVLVLLILIGLVLYIWRRV